MLINSTELYIGPLRFSHVVQKISLQERKAVSVLDTTRTNKNFVVDSGESDHKAQIRFLFTGLNELSFSLEDKEDATLHELLILFKSSPIISIKNKLLSTAWRKPEAILNSGLYNNLKKYVDTVTEVNKVAQDYKLSTKQDYTRAIADQYRPKASTIVSRPVPLVTQDSIKVTDTDLVAVPLDTGFVKQKSYMSDVVPVALEKIELENVPELPNSVQVTLTIARIDISAVSYTDSLEYMTEFGNGSPDPTQAFWLRKWIKEVALQRSVSKFKDYGKIEWYGRTAIGKEVKGPEDIIFLKTKNVFDEENCVLLNENTSIVNKFAYIKLSGKTVPTAMHMGSSSRFMSLDLVFINQKSYKDFESFCKFKETSDLINKSYERRDRIVGWNVDTPISNLVSTKPSLFVPVFVYTETGDEPKVINCRVDLIENDLEFFDTNEITLVTGGTDQKKLKEYYDKVIAKEFTFRKVLIDTPQSAINEIVAQTEESTYSMYQLFWPIEKGITTIKTDSSFGILNSDTLRAVMMSEYLDPSQSIKIALLDSTLATGKVVTDRKLTFWDKFSLNTGIIWKSLSAIDVTNKEEAAIYNAIKNVIDGCFLIPSELNKEEVTKALAILLTAGYLGNSTLPFKYLSATTEALNLLAKSKIEFTSKFKDALFNVIIERSPKNKDLPYIYSTEGIYSAFYKLITKYTLSKDATQSQEDSRKELVNNVNKHGSTYPDLLLPTYRRLYGDDWQKFAPTLDDLGISTYSENRDQTLAVQEDDFVNPSAWFFSKRNKKDLRIMARESVNATNKSGPDLSLSVPFNTEDLAEIQKALEIKRTNEDGSVNHTIATKTISDIIQRSLIDYSKSNPSGFREDYVSLSSKYEGKYSSGNDCIKLYIHHNGSYVLPREVNIPGLGAEIYRVIKETKILQSNGLHRIDADAVYTNPIDKEIKFQRNLKENNEACIDSCIDQIPDDQYSLDRLFPAIKVYLLDRRGNDIVADDTLFNVSNVISVDITLDKNDASLAVIKLADPLYNLQNDYFTKSNVISKDKDTKVILHNIKEPDKDSVAKRYKLVQGRSVEIRMGYGSMAYNLPVVFTGRITEILPGDQLTIVCQGWKAELINRQVNFYNNDPKNWGARDLAIQAITYANPEGFGEFYPQHDLNFILKSINPEDVSDAISNSLSNGQNIELEGRGTRSVGERLSNWAARLVGLSSIDKLNQGLDTRLKNIWYPDSASNYNNLFGLRSRFGVMPSWHNDSWIVPLQPCWDVLQEAARHAWNCIIDVVPFDGQATIFMGHPDQPYIYTKGDSLSKSYYNKYKKIANEDLNKKVNELFDLYTQNSEYQGPSRPVSTVFFELLTDKSVTVENSKQKLQEFIQNKFDFNFFLGYKDFINQIDLFKTDPIFVATSSDIIQLVLSRLENSYLPAAILDKVKESGDFPNITLIMFSRYFNLDYKEVLAKWPTVDREVSEIISRGLSSLDYGIKNTLDSLNTNSKIKTLTYLLNASSTSFDLALAEMQFSSFYNRLSAINDAMKIALAEWTAELSLPGRNISYQTEKGKKAFEQYKNLLEQGKNIIRQTIEALPKEYNFVSPVGNKSLSTLLDSATFVKFKAFVYFFCTFLLENEEVKRRIGGLTSALDSSNKLPPNMKVFRVHHFADNEHNIIKNNIVATTREMWNTVVIEHPAPGTAESQVEDRSELYSVGRINAGANWVYYPKQEVTGVIGLQFNPALTLSNKKIKVFTELNCQNPDLAAKLACGHLAEGIRKMYRGNILLLGKNIKPHDRIILADQYTKISGPVEVESIIHHWNVEMGYVTDIIPNAVCDANPGAGILHTAVMETTYQAIYNITEFISDALTWATIIATLGAATPLALGKFTISKGILGLADRFAKKGVVKTLGTTLSAHVKGLKAIGGSSWNNLKGLVKSGHRLDVIKGLIRDMGGPAASLLKNEMLIAGAEFGTHLSFKSNVIAGFVENADDVEQLPVILSPLLFNNTVFTAGLETDDAVWSISSFGFYYSMKQMQKGISLIIDDLFKENI